MADIIAPATSSLTDAGAITLSGGGYRAMLFHLGFLWRMRDAGLLADIDRIASVSGGSITAGALALAWDRIDWADDGASFRRLVADPIVAMAGHTIDILGGLLGRVPGLSGAWVRRAYDRHLYSSAKLRDLPQRPRFVFNATSIHTGKLVRINRDYIGDWTMGRWEVGDLLVSDAVAASSAFPPVLSPVVLDLAGHAFMPFDGARYAPPPRLHLVDGGVYDNLGIESVWKTHRTVYVSDAGAGFTYVDRTPFLLSEQAIRITILMQAQVGALRFRQIDHDYHADPDSPDRREGFMVAIGYPLEPAPAGALGYDHDGAMTLAGTATRLARLAPAHIQRLVNWGYVATDQHIRGGAMSPGTCVLPYPDAPIA